MTDLQRALQSKEMMDTYFQLHKTEYIIKEIRDYAETEAKNEHYKITGNEAITPHLLYSEISGNPNGFVKGMNLRQHYAGLAMQGLVSKINVYEYKDLAEYSVRAADALIEALNK